MSANLKRIAVSPENYDWLASRGKAGWSFNDVITKLRESLAQDTQKDEKKSPQVSALHIPMLAPTCEATGNHGGCPQ